MPSSTLLDLPVPLAVACHDAGAANVIFAWMREYAAADPAAAGNWRLVVQGPAAKLWAGQGIGLVRLCDTVDEALDGAAAMLTGTAWTSHLEFDARAAAAVRGIRSVAVVDHWANYRPRFLRDGRLVLPDEIVVTDDYAEAEVRRCFPALPVKRHPNRYLEEVLDSIAALPDLGGDILYVLEPVAFSWGHEQAGEFQALDFFVENLALLGLAQDTPIRLRPHPSDPVGKYDHWVESRRQFNVRLDEAPSLAAAISRAAWVAGCESYAMVVALHAGRKVVSTLPPWGHRCRLPHPKIVQLKDLVPPKSGAAQ